MINTRKLKITLCSHANSPNVNTFIAPSCALFLTCRGEKYAVLCERYNNLTNVDLLPFNPNWTG
jgi:hypothetical protein